MRKWILGLTAVATAVTTALVVGNAVATPVIGVTADTARGALTEQLNWDRKFDGSGRTSIKLKTRGAIEVVTQRIEAAPQSTFGWHTHPGDTIVVVKQGTLTLYHDDHCETGTDYGVGTAFPNRREEVHLARNNSATETLVVYATYFFPKTSPPVPVRIDQPLPGSGCPQ